MTLDGVKVDDIVRCSVRGAEFYALVRERTHDGLRVWPIDRRNLPRGASFSEVTSRQVVGIWRKSRRKTAADRRVERKHETVTG